ncbi:hypothetical protein BMS3Bbin03_01986 [bacterium BMS3Bbin03]|nr:hypothetical protein BMS3Bbin03_01986 [bacterium BMS3Bbin03]
MRSFVKVAVVAVSVALALGTIQLTAFASGPVDIPVGGIMSGPVDIPVGGIASGPVDIPVG